MPLNSYKSMGENFNSLNLKMDGKLSNDYNDNANIGKGIKFGKNADGSFFTLRPILSQNILQITKNDQIGLVNIDSRGNISGQFTGLIGTNARFINPQTNQQVKPVYSRLSADGEHTIEILWHNEGNFLVFYVDGQVIATLKRGTNI